MKRRVYVVVLAGLRPEEVSEALTPNLLALRNDGTYFPQARSAPAVETIPDPASMLAPVLDRLPEQGFRTCSVLPDTKHPADAFTSHALHTMIEETDPDLVFVAFGDGDPPLGMIRSLAVRTSDEQVGKLVRHLKATGRWDRSVLVVVAGGSSPSTGASLQRHIDADSLLRGKVVVASNQLHWTGSASDRAVAWRHLESVVSRVCRPATAPVPLLVAGGDPVAGRGVSAAPVSTVDVAPTVGRLFGLPEPPGGYAGRAII
ncbi:hypothetical protein ACWGE0_24075 [Lentzea sp. NPDC054927]